MRKMKLFNGLSGATSVYRANSGQIPNAIPRYGTHPVLRFFDKKKDERKVKLPKIGGKNSGKK